MTLIDETPLDDEEAAAIHSGRRVLRFVPMRESVRIRPVGDAVLVGSFPEQPVDGDWRGLQDDYEASLDRQWGDA